MDTMRGKLGRYVRWSQLLLVGLVIMVGLLSYAPVAHADPHAMFYTVIGQQQLFFNVLAALDQADYVETPQQRNSLAQQRAAAGFKPEDFQTLVPTQTNLSSVLTRGVTLEGQDLWSAYQAQQLATETARRQATSEFVALGCERGLGRIGCSRNASEWQQNQAFVKDAIDWSQQYFQEGIVAMLISGTEDDQKIRKERLDPNDPKTIKQPKTPRAYSAFIADIRQKIEAITDERTKKEFKEEFADRLQAGADQFLAEDLRFDAFNNITITADGVAQPTKQFSTTDPYANEDWVTDYLNDVLAQTNLVAAIQEELTSGADFVRDQQALTEEQGAVADLEYVPKVYIDSDGKSTLGEIRTQIKTPAYAKLALTNATANAIGNLDQNIAYAPPEAVKTPGNVKLVGPKENVAAGQVQGATTTADSNGQVLGLLDNPYLSSYQETLLDQPNRVTNGPDVNPVSPNREEIITSALRAFTGETYRFFDPSATNTSCGYCTSLTKLIQVRSKIKQ